MNIPEHARRKIVSNVKLNPHELGTLLRAVISCLDSVDSLKDERYRATLLVLRDRLVKVSEESLGVKFVQRPETEEGSCPDFSDT